jgi:hypothetical protein
MPPTETTTEVAVKLRLSQMASERLAQQAAQTGRELNDYASELIENAVTKPSVDELLSPFRKQIAASGMSDDDLDTFHEQLRDKVWQDKHTGK